MENTGISHQNNTKQPQTKKMFKRYKISKPVNIFIYIWCDISLEKG